MGYLYELRIALEGEAAVLASKRASSIQIHGLEQRLIDLDRAMEEGRDGTSENVAFHRALIEASANPYLIRFTSWLSNRIKEQIQVDRDLAPEKGLPFEVQQEHIRIYQAIKEGDSIKAKQIVTEHFINAARRTGINIDER